MWALPRRVGKKDLDMALQGLEIGKKTQKIIFNNSRSCIKPRSAPDQML